jgi:hypothetical protein
MPGNVILGRVMEIMGDISAVIGLNIICDT